MKDVLSARTLDLISGFNLHKSNFPLGGISKTSHVQPKLSKSQQTQVESGKVEIAGDIARMGFIYLYTGTGAGKTTNALGLALRSIGHKRKVVIIQFLKWWKKVGEYKIQNVLAPYYEIFQFGRKGWHGLSNLGEEDRRLAYKALEFAEKIVKQKKPHLLILDEINLALHCNLLDVKDVLEFLDRVPKKTDIVLTGRFAPKELINRAEFVNEVIAIKYPKEMVTTKGIQY